MEPLPRLGVSVFEAEHPEAAGLVRALLRPGEKIKLITTGWRSWFVDDVFLGVPTLLANRHLIVGTNDRLLLIHTSRTGLRPEGYVEEVPRSCILGSLGTPLHSIFTTGGTRRFVGVPFSGKRALSFEHDPDRPPTGRPRALCPGCFVPQADDATGCPSCGTAFKTPAGAAWRSLLLPGWGDAWLDSHVVGALTLAVTVFLWLNVAAFLQAAGTAPDQVAVGRLITSFLTAAGMAHLLSAAASAARAGHGLRARDGTLGSKAPQDGTGARVTPAGVTPLRPPGSGSPEDPTRA